MTDIANLAAALAKVQAELPKLERDRTVEVTQKNGQTYSYSYVTLANLSDAVLPLLARHGLSFVAMPGAGADGKMAVRYQLLHESGEALTGEFPVSGEGGIQMVGGRITYARRYCLAAMVGVAADEDDESRLSDDRAPRTAARAARAPSRRPPARPPTSGDGGTAQRARPPAGGPPLPGESVDNGPEPITSAQRTKLLALFGQIGITDRVERLSLSSTIVNRPLDSANDLTKEETMPLIDLLEQAAAKPDPQAWLDEVVGVFPINYEGEGGEPEWSGGSTS